MITATQAGNNWYVEGDRYKALVTKAGITELCLKLTGAPAINILEPAGIVFHEGYGQTSGTVTLSNADSSLALVEANAVRAVLSVDGFYEPGSGGTKYGTGQGRLVFYPDRFAVESVSQFSSSLGTGMCLRPIVANFHRGKEWYDYDTDGAGAFTRTEVYDPWSIEASGVPGPLSVQTVHPTGALPAGLITVVLLNGQNFTSFELWHGLQGGLYLSWRAQKSGAAAGQRYRVVSVFNFATTTNVQDPETAPAVAFRDDTARPDPLNGAANAGTILMGSKVTTGAGDENADGWCERETAYVMACQSLAGYLDFRFDDRRGTSVAAAFKRPVIKLVSWQPTTKPEVYKWTGAAWQMMAEGTDYKTTEEADEGGVGSQTRVVEILSDLSGQGQSGPRFKFVEVFQGEPGPTDWALKAAGQTVDMAASKVSLRRLENSWRRGRVLEFAQESAHTQGSWHEGQEVELSFRDARVFFGDIEERALVGAPGAEEVIYRARDIRARLERVSVVDPVVLAPRLVFNAPEGDADHDDARSGLTVGGVIQWLFTTFAAQLVSAGAAEAGVAPYEAGDLSGLDAVPPKTVLSTLNFDEGLRSILAYDPEVVIIADPAARKFRFKRLGALAAKDITYNSADRPLTSLVRPTLEGRYTAYKIVGRASHTSVSAYLSSGDLEKHWGGRAATTAAAGPGSGVYIPVDNTAFFAAGDTIEVGSGASGETTILISVPSATQLRANLSKAHASGTVITNKAYLEAHWTLAKAFEPGDRDTGTATSGASNRLSDTSKSWAADRWLGAEVTLTKGGLIQKRTVTDSDATSLYVAPDWTNAPAAGDAYEVTRGVSRYRYVFSRYRVTDPSKRRIGATVPDPQNLAPFPGLALVSYKPRVWRKTPSGYWVIVPVVFDYGSGIFTTASPAADGNLTVEGAAAAAPDMRLDYAYLGDPCVARSPASGYTGTAYSQGGLSREKVRYEENFATPASAAQYQALAGRLLWPLKDVAWMGELSLAVAEPLWLELDYRVNIKAKDDAGGGVATGLEAIGALVASARIDFGANRTVVTLADAQALAAQGDWFKTLPDTLVVYQAVAEGSVAGGGGSHGGGTDIYVTINDLTELMGGDTYIYNGGAVTSVSGGGSNGIIQVSPETGNVVVSHADYTSGERTPCNYAPRWQ